MTDKVVIIALGVITIVAGIIIHYRFRQAHFEMWVSQFEDVLGEKVPQEDIESILRDIFTEHEVSISRAIILYKEAKNA